MSPATRHPSPSRERGVALVITLILLAVITFMAVTFLVLSNAEKSAAQTAKDQTTSRNATDAARDRFVADLHARIFVTGNPYNAGLFVSTNYQNPAGFINSGVVDPRNVNFDYKQNGAALSGVEMNENLLNLLYDPRAPVYVTNRAFANSVEFRFYLDVNRNGRFDTNGVLPERDSLGLFIPSPTGGFLSNYFTGDPQWIGILERPEFPHSPSNRFIARYCYFAVPIGNALDVNYVHNQARNPNKAALDVFGADYLRNQGVGPWEINLAAFFTDLNTNLWGRPGFYSYDPLLSGTVSGTAFADAMAIYRYRLNNSATQLRSVFQMYGSAGANEFGVDFRDGYTATPFLVNYAGLTIDGDTLGRTQQPWPGAENPNHLFNHQDFFDATKVGAIATKLNWLSTSNSTYDNSTFFRMIEQVGTDSAPEVGKMNLNYDNVVARHPVTGSISETNFYDWTPLTFFTNAADRILRAQFGFGVQNIPVYTNGVFTYTPSVQRSLQLAANLAEVSATNGTLAAYGLALPSVFRPLILRSNNGVYIVGFTEVGAIGGARDPQLTVPLSLANSNNFNLVPTSATALNIYGVPWVIGARKGLPNFNEFALQSTFQITRKLQLTKPNYTSYATRAGWQTNLMYVIGVSNAVAAEAWNSYLADFNRGVDVYLDNDLEIELTNNSGLRLFRNYTMPKTLTVAANQWRGWSKEAPVNGPSFLVPLQTNILFLPDSVYRFASKTLVPSLDTAFEPPSSWPGGQWPVPQWGLNVTNRLRFIIRDQATGRVLDYVQLDNLNGVRDLSREIVDADKATGFKGQWSTNRLAGSVPQGVYNQIDVSLGNSGGTTTDWMSYGLGQPTGDTKKKEIDRFRVFNGLSPVFFPDMKDTNLVIQVPFTPTKRLYQYVTWQANDPLVHYLPGDMAAATNLIQKVDPNEIIPSLAQKNIGSVNDRYEPWGGPKHKTGGQGGAGFPNAFKTGLKDPGVTRPDDWDFPTNKFPNVGWMGRLHRGSPWQTVYLKSDETDNKTWKEWSGNDNELDALVTQPRNDRLLFDLFTATFDENITRGLLPVNQTNLAAWSAVFGGVITLSNNTAFGGVDRFVINPVAVDGTNGPLARIHAGISRTRSDTNRFARQTFNRLGDVLSVPELTDASPFMPDKSSTMFQRGMRDAVYEWLPQQVMGLLKFSEPRYVVYAYGQSLKPARGSIVTGGPFFGLCTNYQVTAEIATRSVLTVENPTTTTPRVVLENFNILPPD